MECVIQVTGFTLNQSYLVIVKILPNTFCTRVIRAKEVVVMLVQELCNRLELLCVIILYLIQWNRTPTSANNCEPFLVSCTQSEWILSKA